MQVRELELRDSLGRAHEMDLGLNAKVSVLTRKSDLLAQELEDGKTSWALERISLRANATHHEGRGRGGSQVRSRETKGEIAAALLELGEARLRQLSPDIAGRAPGSGMHMVMDTPIGEAELQHYSNPSRCSRYGHTAYLQWVLQTCRRLQHG